MGQWTNLFRRKRLMREIDEELASHLAEAADRGRDPAEAQRAFGSPLRQREASLDARLASWLDALRADAVFGWRQIRKRKVSSAAAVLSLALALGACTAAFRLIDALLLRPLPVAHPERLYSIAREGVGPGGDFRISESCEYPLFLRMREATRGRADLIAASYADRIDLTYASDNEMEKAWRQYVSGAMFDTFGLKPAAGRLLTADDDVTPGAHPWTVLSHDYWTRRFARDPQVVSRTLRIGTEVYRVAGVLPPGFTGTEPGILVDIFVPAIMNPNAGRSDSSWFRPFALVRPGISIESLRQELHGLLRAFSEERARGWKTQTRQFLDRFLNQKLLLLPAASGVSGMQTQYRQALLALGLLVALVLAIGCANVANLLTAQASARAREMAMRVSIGAGRGRLVQLMLIEAAWLGGLATVLGAGFAWWAAPFVLSRINPSGNPARLDLPADWRVLGFTAILALSVTVFFGLFPALRASAVHPARALKGGDGPPARGRLMRVLVAVQVSFCFIVHLAAGLFVVTLDRLAHQPTGFAAERLLAVEIAVPRPQPAPYWDQVADHVRGIPGVESVARSGWPLLGGNGWNGFIWVDNAATEVLAYFLPVSPQFTGTMKIPLVQGRELRSGDEFPGAALVNEAFVQQCLHGRDPVGRWFEKETGNGVTRQRLQVVGVVGNARYRNMREPITPTVYVPFAAPDAKGAIQPQGSSTLMVRTISSNPMALAQVLRQEVPRARPGFRVSNIRTQVELVEQNTIRERLLAMLALFFAGVALLLSAVGLYGVLDYSVLQRRREIGIRIAVGASAADIARRLTGDVLSMVLAGAIAGLGGGLLLAKYVKSLLYGIAATDPAMLAIPILILAAASAAAAAPAVLRAVRVDPMITLRTE